MITRIHGDMLAVAAAVKDCSIDLLLTDPPYNISANGAAPQWTDPVTGENKNGIHSQRFSESFDEDWDSVDHDQFVAQLHSWSEVWARVLRRGGQFAIFISDRYISYLWTALEAHGLEPKRVITWKKPAAVPFNRRVNPVSGCEYILWGIKPGGRRSFNADNHLGTIVERASIADKVSSIVYRAIRESSGTESMAALLQSVASEAQRVVDSRKIVDDKIECVIPNTFTYSGGLGKDKIHPTQKPTEVLKYLISLMCNPGDLVLDTFAGSGSTGIAAQELNRRSILIERDSKMFNLMDARCAQYTVFEDTQE